MNRSEREAAGRWSESGKMTLSGSSECWGVRLGMGVGGGSRKRSPGSPFYRQSEKAVRVWIMLELHRPSK
jgi:hypothetical protein